ncbi:MULTISPECIES: hypothetical protein [Actibacterium]|uniref:Uncharacterized protein n=1 Tax=Actibacterium naphthalenivorans TaxID=1614693 RepID=A0A840C8S2_9RHOB|nr:MULTISPECIES: hypothetical protein [Actibacterium]MBB4022331.1 hypothetical protein [Actibacterium naphthalenivorans]
MRGGTFPENDCSCGRSELAPGEALPDLQGFGASVFLATYASDQQLPGYDEFGVMCVTSNTPFDEVTKAAVLISDTNASHVTRTVDDAHDPSDDHDPGPTDYIPF